MAHGRLNSEVLWHLLLVAKGLRTAVRLDVGPTPDPADDPESAELLARLAAPALSPAGRAGLRRAFERRRDEVELAHRVAPRLVDLAGTRAAAGPGTLLLTSWTALYPDDTAVRVALVVAADDIALLTTDPAPVGEPLPALPLGILDVLTARAAEGDHHLCVVPDAEGYGLDWHAVPYGAGVLADHWTTTLLPHPHALRPDPAAAGGPSVAAVLAVGLDDPGPGRGLPVLADAEDEARAVAATHEVSPGHTLVGPAATIAAVTASMPLARRLHVASHGVLDPDAPSFHALVLADGDLAAWQVAGLDLSGVDVVTLSACFSARLVTAPGDNVDGLPLAFLRAGARAVVGTTTEIDSAASRLFFETFHAGVRDGGPDLRPPFRAAQQAVRAAHPDPATWASFYLLGDWR